MSCEQKFKDELRRQGFRLTPQREAVLEALHELKDRTTTAEALHELARQADPGIDLVTIYRTLELLSDLGFVKCIETGHKERHWQFLGAEEYPHPHLLCRACGELVGIEEASIAQLRQCLREQYGFEPAIGRLTIPGLCARCRQTGDADG